MQKKTEVLSPLGTTIRQLLKTRKIKAYQLAEQVGLSPTSISKILNGLTRPRDSTFQSISQVLCRTEAEQQRLLAAFTGVELPAPSKQRNQDAEQELQRLRAEQFLERRTQAIQFKRSVARELDKAGIAYQQDYCQGPYSTDFLIEKDGQRIALECRVNAGREMDELEQVSEVLKQKLGCVEVLLVVPFLESNYSREVSILDLVFELSKRWGPVALMPVSDFANDS